MTYKNTDDIFNEHFSFSDSILKPMVDFATKIINTKYSQYNEFDKYIIDSLSIILGIGYNKNNTILNEYKDYRIVPHAFINPFTGIPSYVCAVFVPDSVLQKCTDKYRSHLYGSNTSINVDPASGNLNGKFLVHPIFVSNKGLSEKYKNDITNIPDYNAYYECMCNALRLILVNCIVYTHNITTYFEVGTSNLLCMKLITDFIVGACVHSNMYNSKNFVNADDMIDVFMNSSFCTTIVEHINNGKRNVDKDLYEAVQWYVNQNVLPVLCKKNTKTNIKYGKKFDILGIVKTCFDYDDIMARYDALKNSVRRNIII